jgi:hypothetical protein
MMTRLNRSSKYNNVRCELDGITFDSKAERNYYIELDLMKKAGLVKWFNRQPSFLLPGGIRYRPDFVVCDKDGLVYVVDVKGMETGVFKLKQKLWNETYPDIELRIVK